MSCSAPRTRLTATFTDRGPAVGAPGPAVRTEVRLADRTAIGTVVAEVVFARATERRRVLRSVGPAVLTGASLPAGEGYVGAAGVVRLQDLMHDHAQIQDPPVRRRLADGGPPFAFAQRLPLHVRVKDVGRLGRGIRIEGQDVVGRGLSERVDLYDDPEPAELDSFKHDRRCDDREGVIAEIDREAVELRLEDRQIVQDLTDRRDGPLVLFLVEIALPSLQMMDDGANQRGMLSPQPRLAGRPTADAAHFQTALEAEQPLPVVFRKGAGSRVPGLLDLPCDAGRQPEPFAKRRGLRRSHGRTVSWVEGNRDGSEEKPSRTEW